MKKVLFILAAVLLGLYLKLSWVTVEHEGSNAKVKFPGNPEYSSQIVEAPIIGKIKIDNYKFVDNNTTFGYQITENLEVDVSDESLSDAIRTIKRYTLRTGSKIIDEAETTTFGYDSYLITSLRRNGGIMYHKIIKIDNKQYMMSVYFKDGNDNQELVDEYYNTFEVI